MVVWNSGLKYIDGGPLGPSLDVEGDPAALPGDSPGTKLSIIITYPRMMESILPLERQPKCYLFL